MKKAFYASAFIFETLKVFGEVSDEVRTSCMCTPHVELFVNVCIVHVHISFSKKMISIKQYGNAV